ncbi:MAG: B12-binding domain-containing radical SAM protein [Planctomycetales bacterium]|nr:B12-binding domain-containing radical SAM protein [Planctomycetales bacterium]
MRVLLIYPAIDCPAGMNHGIISLSGVLKHGGHEVKLVYANEQVGPIPTLDEITETVREWKPGLIGYSVMSQQYAWSIEVAKHVKSLFPAIPSIIGGVHCTMVPDEVVNENHFDYVCPGEGEYALLELVNRLEKGEDTTRVPNLRMVRNGKKIVNPVGPFPDLAKLPPLDYDIFDVGHMVTVKKGWLGLLASRGCPYKCTYCFNKEIVDLYLEEGGAKKSKDYLRVFPIERVMEDIQLLKRKHPHISTIIFDDDLFTLNKKFVLDFCKAYKESKIELPFVVNAHVQVFDEDMAFALKDAGCMILKWGLESGSYRIRKEILWRFMSNDQILRSFEVAHRYNLHTSAFIMFGLPDESRAEVFETLKICAQAKMGRFRWAIFYPFPGTAGYTIAKDRGLIDWDKAKGMGNYFDASCLKFSPEHDLFLEKLGKVAHWWVNSLSDWPSAPTYKKLVDEVESWDRDTWEARKNELAHRDRDLSEKLLAADVPHYSLRYTHVMGVHSDFVKWERAQKARGEQAVGANYRLDD